MKFARMAELVDALGSGSSEDDFVGVRVPFRAQNSFNSNSYKSEKR